MMLGPLPKGSQEFLNVCRRHILVSDLESTRLGQFPSRTEQMSFYVGRDGINITDPVDWLFNIENCRRHYGMDLYNMVRDGFTDIFISGNRRHNRKIAAQTLRGERTFIPTLHYLVLERITPIAVSFKHGADEQLSLQRLLDGICALEHFLEPGTRFVLWIDLVQSIGLIKRQKRSDISWLKRGLLPYQLFVVLCLDNSNSGRARDDYVTSFWLNIEGVLATLGSGMVMIGPDLKRNAVASWLFEDKRSDIPIYYVKTKGMPIAFRVGNTMNCEEALKFLLQNAIKGAYDKTIARYQKDKEDLIQMANCLLHVRSYEDFGKVAYDLNYSNYEELFQTLSGSINPEQICLPLYITGPTYKSVMDGEHTMYPTYIKSIINSETRSTYNPQWLPKHCRYFRTPVRPKEVHDIWIHFQNHSKLVAVIAIAIVAPKSYYTARLHVKMLKTKECDAKSSDLKTYEVEREIDLWDSRVPILLRDVLKMLEGQHMSLAGVRQFLNQSGLECPELTSFFVSTKFESALSETEEIDSGVKVDEHSGEASKMLQNENDGANELVKGEQKLSEDQCNLDTPDPDESDESEFLKTRASLCSPCSLDMITKQFRRLKMMEEAWPFYPQERMETSSSDPRGGPGDIEHSRAGNHPMQTITLQIRSNGNWKSCLRNTRKKLFDKLFR